MLMKHGKLIAKKVAVPFKSSDLYASDEEMRNLQREIDHQDSDRESFANYYEQTSKDVKRGIEKAEALTRTLETEKAGGQINSPDQSSIHSIQDDIDEMDYLFDNDEVESETAPRDEARIRSDCENADVSLKNLLSYSEAFNSLLKAVNREIHSAIGLMKKIFCSAYRELDCDDGFDVIMSCVLHHLFAGIQSEIDFVYRYFRLG